MKRWVQRRTKVDTIQMAQELGVTAATASVLANRGIVDRKQTEIFLQGTKKDLHDSFDMKDMERGVAFIADAIGSGRPIVVYGDYDVDGVMSTTILYKTISRCGGVVSYYVPHRQKEGYGLNMAAVEKLVAEGTKVLFTCDNGISANEEIERAKELGMTVIVLDHHEPRFVGEGVERQDLIPRGDAIIDPKQKACSYPFPMLCAGGISYKFAICLLRAFHIQEESLEKQLISFAAIATVCDIVDLLDENRVLVKMGLAEIRKTENLGLSCLIDEAGLGDKIISEYHLGFVIGPCINATGRLERGSQAVDLFTEEDETRAREMARLLLELNQTRKELTARGTASAMAQAETASATDSILVLYDSEIHESIAGIVAGRVKDKFYRPVIMITGAEDGAKGSGRSIEGYNLFDALFENQDLFSRFGGHAMAAGLSLPVENIEILRQRLNNCCLLTEEEMTPVLRVDRLLSFHEIDLALAKELRLLAPFGKENPMPLFATMNILVDRVDLMGKNKDMLRLSLRQEENGIRQQGVSFDGYERLCELLKELYPSEECDKLLNGGKIPQKMDFIYGIDVNTYNGRSSVQLMIKDFRFSK